MATHSTIKLAVIWPYLYESQSAALVAAHYGRPLGWARTQVAQVEVAEIQAGLRSFPTKNTFEQRRIPVCKPRPSS